MRFVNDLRHAFRSLGNTPRYASIAILTIAVGVGATSVIFSLINATLLQLPPFQDPERLVAVSQINPAIAPNPIRVSVPDLDDLQHQTQIFEYIAAYRDRKLTLRGNEPVRINGSLVSLEFFRVLGTQAYLGRTFAPGEERQHVAVLSYRFWQSYFHGDRTIVNKEIVLDDKTYAVIGIMPSGFHILQESDAWAPLEIADSMRQMRGAHFLDVVARLKSGISLEQARTAANKTAQNLAQVYPDTNSGESIRLEPLTEEMNGHMRPRLMVLSGAVGFVLLITCSNVSGLLVARAYSRQREFALRMALGGSRRHIIRQVLAESLSLGLLGGGLGLLFGYVVMRLMPSWKTIAVLHINTIHLDGAVFGFALLLSLTASFVFGIIPALQAAKADVSSTLKGEPVSSSLFIRLPGDQRMRSILIVGEIALAQVLLFGAAVFGKSFLRLASVDPGFQAENLISIQMPLSTTRYPQGAAQSQFFESALERLRAMQQVRSAAATSALPLTGADAKMDFSVSGQRNEQWASARVISPGYFSTMSIPLNAGREFTAADNKTHRKVVIVNEVMAKQLAVNGLSPLNREAQIGDESFTVVGIVGNVLERSLAGGQEPAVYFSMFQNPQNTMVLVVRTKGDPLKAAPELRGVLRSQDPQQVVESIQTIIDVLSSSIAPPRFSALLLLVLAVLAVVLAMAGVYGLIAYIVEKRTREIGIRLALGAQLGNVIQLILHKGLILGSIGLAIGVTIALSAKHLVSSLLFGIQDTELVTLIAVSMLLLAATILACWIPALRATRITPIDAIRMEN